MGEHTDVVAELGAGGVLAGVRWAYESATRRALETYSEADGHDAAWLGNTRFTLFRDRLDRVFCCQRYALIVTDGDLDVLHAELSDHDIATMPRLAPGTVWRDDLRQSPGWAYGGRRFLLASGEYGRLSVLPWPRRSPTKRIVASQRNPDQRQPSLFEDFAPEEIGGLAALAALDQEGAGLTLDRETFVVAHSLDPVSGKGELVLGRPRLNEGGGIAWHWREDLLAIPLAGDGRKRTEPALTTVAVDAAWAPDAPVRLRPRLGIGQR